MRRQAIYRGSAWCLRPPWSFLMFYWFSFNNYKLLQRSTASYNWKFEINNRIMMWDDGDLDPAESRRLRVRRSLFCWPWGSIYRRRLLIFRWKLGRPLLAREGAHTHGLKKFGPTLASVRTPFESIKNSSNRGEIWHGHSSTCIQASVKISWHLDQ